MSLLGDLHDMPGGTRNSSMRHVFLIPMRAICRIGYVQTGLKNLVGLGIKFCGKFVIVGSS